jgi:hypothetical protein
MDLIWLMAGTAFFLGCVGLVRLFDGLPPHAV